MISIVSGTYNRIASLIRMVQSVRDNIPAGLAYEIVLVDGGSDDGTLQWARKQADVRLIEHGELRGAINAFCDGAKAARGEYVILANDDIHFEQGSIIKAMVYLEQHQQCGAVAFMDNRPLPGERPMDVRYKAQLQIAQDANGDSTQVIYAQVGMFRRWLGDACGWWGADDPIMSQARTYGGDNYLSSRIWEAGYTIDIVREVMCSDHVLPDSLRVINYASNDQAYYKRFPRGPRLNSNPIPAPDQAERLRILYLPIFEPGYSQQRATKRGLRDALSRIGYVWEWDYLNEKVDQRQITDFAPHLILTQFHDARWGGLIEALRKFAPNAYIVNWNGDARNLTTPDYLHMLTLLDLQLVVNAAALSVYQEKGIRAAYWQIGYEDAPAPAQDVAAHDVLFLGNCYNEARRAIETALRSLPCNVGLYGDGWQQADGNCLYDFNVGAGLYQKAKIAISDTFTDGTTPITAFVSNRTFQALAAGAFVLQQYSPRLDEYTGLQSGVHYVEWQTLDDLKELITLYLPEQKERQRIAAAGQAFVTEHYSFDAQVKVLLRDLLPLIEVQRESA